MWIVKIKANPNGSHNSHCADNITDVPEGWAMIPEDFPVSASFPFVTIEAEKNADGVMSVVAMTEGIVPEAPEPVPTAEEDTAAMLVDHEFRLTMLELGLF